MKDPLVSVIVPFLNAERFLDEAIRSVVAQSYGSWELLLVDDGSTDRGTGIARAAAAASPERVRYLEHPGHANRGLSASRNRGLDEARGDYVALLDADDVWLPAKLERQVELFRLNPGATLVYGRSEYWYSWSGAAVEPDLVPDLGAHIPLDTLLEPPALLVLNYPLGQCAAPPPSDLMFRRDFAVRVGGFEERFRGIHQLYEDQAFLCKAYLTERVYVSSESWDRYRQHPDSIVSVVTRDGHYHAVRHDFLQWLRAYLERCAVGDPGVWQALDLALWPYVPDAERLRLEQDCRLRPGDARTARSRQPGGAEAHEGHHDVASCDTISGWAWHPGWPDVPLAVDVYADDRFVLSLPANRYRRDLAGAGKGQGYHAFTCRMPPWLKDGKPHRIGVRVAGSDGEIAGSPKHVCCDLEV